MCLLQNNGQRRQAPSNIDQIRNDTSGASGRLQEYRRSRRGPDKEVQGPPNICEVSSRTKQSPSGRMDNARAGDACSPGRRGKVHQRTRNPQEAEACRSKDQCRLGRDIRCPKRREHTRDVGKRCEWAFRADRDVCPVLGCVAACSSACSIEGPKLLDQSLYRVVVRYLEWASEPAWGAIQCLASHCCLLWKAHRRNAWVQDKVANATRVSTGTNILLDMRPHRSSFFSKAIP